MYFDGAPVQESLVREMSDVLRHRGPDEGGVHLNQWGALGHRRLSIIDLSSGQQPLSNEDGSIWITFNGEIYNYEQLKHGLKHSHSFRTRSDTETIVHLYESYPDTFVERLRGMFAFALWDEPHHTIILARDRVGKKPLYYYLDREKLVFASEIKSILCHPQLNLRIDHQAVSDYLSLGYVPAPKSIYQSIRKVRPGHYVRVQPGRITEVKYWDLNFQESAPRSETQWRELLLDEFKTAVDMRLMSEVPLGAFLSGGLDSSGVVAMMRKSLNHPVKTATIGFNEKRFDESAFSRQVSRHLDTEHHERVVTPDKIVTIQKLAWHYDEPFADSSALPTYFVSQVARERVTVALSGDGGDENFAGYNRYIMDREENRARRFFPLFIRKPIFAPLGFFYPKMDWAPQFLRAKTTFQSLAVDHAEGYFESVSTFREYEKRLILSGDLKQRLAGYRSSDLFREYYLKANTTDPLSRIQYVDVKTYLTDDILTKVDRASMANSLEVRCPLLDHHLMELAASMPSGLKLRGTTSKYILKKALANELPTDIVHRTKMGFGVPLADWFQNGIRDYARTYILERRDPYLSDSFVAKMWRQHQSGYRDRSTQLWNVLMFRLWLDQFPAA
ncbi:MAG: asparagine synthase (glutamine-hydrolyzing) [Acidobacteria bacterium]|nr:MAG: asparagine synthase (glutamine-hydrolyzing) [Acidobacteriota bacterium]